MGGLSADLRRISRAVAIAACIVVVAAGGAAANAPKPRFSGQEVWGWVVARHPSTSQYTPSARDQRSSNGGTSTVEREQKGVYLVTFDGLATGGGGGAVIHVSPLSTSSRLCVLDGWEETDSSDYLVRVDCRNRLGSHVDSGFVVNLLALFTLQDDLGYVIANKSLDDYIPAVQYNSAEETNTVHRLGTGRWRVTLPGIGGSSGHGSVQVTAAGQGGTACRISSWTAGVEATVACRDRAGTLRDRSFTLTYMKGRGLKFEGDSHVAFVLADHPTTAAYTPTSGYRFSTCGYRAAGVSQRSRGLLGQARGDAARRQRPSDGVWQWIPTLRDLEHPDLRHATEDRRALLHRRRHRAC